MNTNHFETPAGDFYKILLDCLFDAVYTVDNRGVITYWNRAAERITGYSAVEVVGQRCSETGFVDSGETDEGSDKRRGGIEIVLDTGMPGTWKGFVRRKNGQRLPVESHISPLRNDQEEIVGAVEAFRDISAFASLETAHRQVLAMARKDPLTGLFNRGATSELLKAEVSRSRRYQQKLSVIMIDLDHFKQVNDDYGHESGDKVLAKVGAILVHNLRGPDAVGRWGGEEFLVIAPGSDRRSGAGLAERLRGYLKDIDPSEIPTAISASFGVAEFMEGQSVDELLYQADQALYRAKDAGRDRVVTDEPVTTAK